MPTSAQFTAAFMQARYASAPPFQGQAFEPLARGLGNAIAQWSTGSFSNLGLSGTAVGTSGAGVISPDTTKLFIPFDPSVILGALQGAGISGSNASALAIVVGAGVVSSFLGYGRYAGATPGVGSGQDVSTVTTANGATLAQALFWALEGAFGSTGPYIVRLCEGLGFGIASLLFQGKGTGTVVGAPGPSPASTATQSVVI